MNIDNGNKQSFVFLIGDYICIYLSWQQFINIYQYKEISYCISYFWLLVIFVLKYIIFPLQFDKETRVPYKLHSHECSWIIYCFSQLFVGGVTRYQLMIIYFEIILSSVLKFMCARSSKCLCASFIVFCKAACIRHWWICFIVIWMFVCPNSVPKWKSVI